MGRDENVRIFEDTRRQYETHPVLVKSIRKSKAGQKMYGDQPVEEFRNRHVFDTAAEIVVSRKRSFEAARAYLGQPTCVLNFASASNPGGGVVRGASAQEECLCRCSTLYANLNTRAMWDSFYTPHRQTGDPLHNDDCIYTPGVTVFKSDTAMPELLSEEDWYSVNIITCAAPNLRRKPSNAMNPGDGRRNVVVSDQRLREMHERRLRKVADLAAAHGDEVLILGAFGCGAFENPPQVVAMAMKTIVNEYRYCFKTIEFAVYCPPGRDENYRMFANVLCGR